MCQEDPSAQAHAMFLQRLERRLLRYLIDRAAARGEPPELMSRIDPLTGLLNLLAFTSSLKRVRDQDVEGSIALLDIDFFKLVNDRYGHAVGDFVLCTLGQRIATVAPDRALVSRFGGDEFCVFVPGSIEEGRAVAEALLSIARQPMEREGLRLAITVSIGFAALPLSIGLEEAMRSADVALYAAKNNCRDQVLEVNNETQQIVSARRELAHAVIQLQDKNAALKEQLQTDALTGLLNRRALEAVLAAAQNGSASGWQRCAVAFLDIDHFGNYNKHHGDAQGDGALRSVAQAVQRTARKGDMVFRKGGEEIVVILPEATEEDARSAAERMRSAVEALAVRHEGSTTAEVLTVTVGVAAASDGEKGTLQELMERAADAAMQAKLASQRNQVHFA